jgi:hypothetical protein
MSEAVNLNEREALCLALRIAMVHVVDSDRWLEWKNYPMLGEFAFQRLDETMRSQVADVLRSELRRVEGTWNLDSAALLESAS